MKSWLSCSYSTPESEAQTKFHNKMVSAHCEILLTGNEHTECTKYKSQEMTNVTFTFNVICSYVENWSITVANCEYFWSFKNLIRFWLEFCLFGHLFVCCFIIATRCSSFNSWNTTCSPIVILVSHNSPLPVQMLAGFLQFFCHILPHYASFLFIVCLSEGMKTLSCSWNCRLLVHTCDS